MLLSLHLPCGWRRSSPLGFAASLHEIMCFGTAPPLTFMALPVAGCRCGELRQRWQGTVKQSCLPARLLICHTARIRDFFLSACQATINGFGERSSSSVARSRKKATSCENSPTKIRQLECSHCYLLHFSDKCHSMEKTAPKTW